MPAEGLPANRLDFGDVIPFTDKIFGGSGGAGEKARRDAAE